ncbi:MAG: hypothetical protein CM1200mP18_18960 [Gammaproteobacteria bacterium]|nr:MAG: hypothetical protein CM1200mP18_18960 [Gammaproteobacteria bacterium]
MSDKQKIIQKMIQMQKQFIARERKSGYPGGLFCAAEW